MSNLKFILFMQQFEFDKNFENLQRYSRVDTEARYRRMASPLGNIYRVLCIFRKVLLDARAGQPQLLPACSEGANSRL